MDSSRLRTGELVAGIGGIALFVFLFFDWFSAGLEGFGGGGVSGWDGLGADVTGFVVALTSVAAVALAVLAMAGQRVNIPLPRGSVTAALGSLSVLIILWRLFANPGDLKVGIFLGLAAAVAIAVGALMALREEGFEPLVKVPGGRTRAAAASAPPAPPAPTSPTEETVEVPATSTSKASSGSASKASSKSGAARKSGTRSTSSRARSSSKSGGSGSTRKRSSGGSK